MLEFRKVNKNPMGKKTGDCTTRAIANVLDITWEKAIQEQCEGAIKTSYSLCSNEVIDYVMNKYGYVKMKQPRKLDNKKFKVVEMDIVLTKQQMLEGVLINVANHTTCIKNDDIQDIWNCGYKTVCNYWVKEN